MQISDVVATRAARWLVASSCAVLLATGCQRSDQSTTTTTMRPAETSVLSPLPTDPVDTTTTSSSSPPAATVASSTVAPSTNTTKPAATTAPKPVGVTMAQARSLELPVGTCFWMVEAPGPRLADGLFTPSDGGSITLSEDNSIVADYTGDGIDDALLMLDCDGGGVHTWSSLVAVIANGPTLALAPNDVVAPSGLPAGSELRDWGVPSFDDGKLALDWTGADDIDPECCPQYSMTSVGTIDAKGFHAESTSGIHNLTNEDLVLGVAAPSNDSQAPAKCVTDELYFRMPDRKDEVALYQQKLRELGYYDGDIDGLFGPGTLDAAMAEIKDNGALGDEDGNFVDAFPDDGAILRPAFERLGIACSQ